MLIRLNLCSFFVPKSQNPVFWRQSPFKIYPLIDKVSKGTKNLRIGIIRALNEKNNELYNLWRQIGSVNLSSEEQSHSSLYFLFFLVNR